MFLDETLQLPINAQGVPKLHAPGGSMLLFEELHGTFVTLCGGATSERAEVLAPPSSSIGFARIQPILPRLELADHATAPYLMS